VLGWVDAGAQVTSAQNRIIIARILDSIDVDETLAEAQPIFWGERALVNIADRNTFLITTDIACAWNTSKADEFSFDHMAVVINA